MRIVLVILLGLTAGARADGGYVIEAFGGGAYQGDLARSSKGEVRVQLGAGYVRGPWAIEASAAAYVPNFLYIDCYGDECLAAAAPPAGLVVANLDVRRAWRVLFLKWSRKIGLDFVLHGGPRVLVGRDSLDGYTGPGLGGGAAIEVSVRVISLFMDSGMDLGLMRGSDGDVLTAKVPYLTFGARIGWL